MRLALPIAVSCKTRLTVSLTVLSLELTIPQKWFQNTLRSLTIDNSGHDIFSVNSNSCCLGIPDHLKDLYQRTVKGTSEEQYSQVTNLPVEYQDVFARNADGVSVDPKNVDAV